MTLTTHFAPSPTKLSGVARTESPSVISVTALAGISGFVRQNFGDRVLRGANQAAMLDIEAIEDQDCFIPHITMTTFADAIARLSGQSNIGLTLAPHLTIANYGRWGEYVLAAATLGAAVERAIATLGFHTNADRLSVANIDGRLKMSYVSAAKAQDGYGHVACGVAGVIVSLCKAYLGVEWRPDSIELDIPTPARRSIFDEAFECQVVFEAPQVSVWLDTDRLNDQSRQRAVRSLVTVEDLARARVGFGYLNGLQDVIAQQIWSQVLTGEVSIDSAARSLNTSVRNLQRQLNRKGTDFRSMVNSMRTKRAIELLRHATASVTDISMKLGYSSPAHFARAFRRETGLNPTEFRQRGQALPNAT